MHTEVNGARIFFDVVGPRLQPDGARMAERPTLIVLHGGPGFDHASMRPYFDRFADTHQVIYLDHRGNGRSGGARETWTLAQWGDDIAGLCQALGIEKPAVFGQSFGGMVAMSYGARHPDGPSKLIFSSTAPTEALATTYIAKCMPLYNPGPPRDGSNRERAILRTEVLFHFIVGEQRRMDLLSGLAAVRCPTL